MEFTSDSFFIWVMAAFFAFLYLRFRKVTKHIRVQQRRYPMFAVRDKLVRMYLDKKISDEALQHAYKFCNNAMFISDEIDLMQLAGALHFAAKATQPRANKALISQLKDNPEFCRLYVEIFSHIIRWSLYNSLAKHPIKLIRLTLEGALQDAQRDFKQILKAKRAALQTA